jgi:regulator of sigma E protease
VKITGMNPNEEIPPEVLPRAYYYQPVWKRIVTILAGPAVNILIAFGLIMGLILAQGQPVYTRSGQPVISRSIDAVGAPASRYLKPGDEIVGVDGRRGLGVPQITTEIGTHHCAGVPTQGCVATTPVRLTIRRNGRLKTFDISPRYDTKLKRVLVGIDFGQQTTSVDVAAAASQSLSGMWRVTRLTVGTIGRIFEPKERRQISSVVGGYTVTEESFAHSTTQALEVLALVSLSLGVINLFPFLPLDGGHVFWALAEKVRGRRISFSVMERAGVVGFALILLLFVIGLSNDISTLTGKGFPVR